MEEKLIFARWTLRSQHPNGASLVRLLHLKSRKIALATTRMSKIGSVSGMWQVLKSLLFCSET